MELGIGASHWMRAGVGVCRRWKMSELVKWERRLETQEIADHWDLVDDFEE